MTTREEGNARLLNVAKALREASWVLEPSMFDMEVFAHECGTPACALGHYAARGDLQNVFKLGKRTTLPGLYMNALKALTDGGQWADVHINNYEVLEHFDISDNESDRLFGPPDALDCECSLACDLLPDSYLDHDSGCPIRGGCDGAQTAIEAAEYIENFVKERS